MVSDDGVDAQVELAPSDAVERLEAPHAQLGRFGTHLFLAGPVPVQIVLDLFQKNNNRVKQTTQSVDPF